MNLKKTLTIILLASSTLIFAQEKKHSKVKIHFNPSNYEQLLKSGISLEGAIIVKDKHLTGIFSEQEIQSLNRAGFQTELIIDDMSKYYVDRNLKPIPTAEESKAGSSCNNETVVNTPTHFRLGGMGGYLTLDQIMAELDSMRRLYPNLISVRKDVNPSISTHEGRKLQFAMISNNPNTEDGKPKILYSALTHAREPLGMQQLIFYMWYLLENYDTKPEIKYLVDHLQLYFIPCVNPDGYRYNQTTNPSGGGMQRTNMRWVDINRNYGFDWGINNTGSSPNSGDETYRGTAAFSEAESQSMKSFCESRNFVFNLDYHTYGNFLIFPNKISMADNNLMNAYAEMMNKDNGTIYGSEISTVGYQTNGASNDWFYGEQSTKNKILSFIPEVGYENDGFWAPSSRIIPLSKAIFMQNLALTHLALKYAVAKDETPFILSDTNGYLRYSVTQLGQQIAASYEVRITPISTAFTQPENSKNYSFQTVSQTIMDSIPYALSPNTAIGEELKYEISISNGDYTYRDTITKVFGIPYTLLSDSCNNTNNWTVSGSWATTSSTSHASGSCITDSPSGDYASSSTTTITTKNAIDLTAAKAAYLSFFAKWNIGKGYDCVQLKISTDNGTTWTALCGKHTALGSSTQVSGEPVYDGYQMDWNHETISLQDYLGKSVKLQFKFKSVNIWNRDGFYFDDFEITTLRSAGTIATTGDTICKNGDPIAIASTTPANGNKTIYKWQANGVDIANSNSATFDPPAGRTETTTYTRWAKDSTWSDFILSSGAWTVVVNDITIATPIITVNGNILQSDAPTGNQWYNQNGLIIEATNQEYTASENGNFHVVATVTGCSSDTSNHITIYLENLTGTIATAGDTICKNGDPIAITSGTPANGSKTTYKWQANGMDLANSNSASFEPPTGLTETTTYTRWAKDSTWSDFALSSGTWQVVVNQVTTPTITASGNVLQSDAPTGNQWYNQNGLIIGAQNQEYTASENGNFHVVATVTGCSSDTSNHITIYLENLTGTIATAGDTICKNGDPIAIASGTPANGSKTTYKWQANGVDIANSDSPTYNPPAGLMETTTYTRWAKDSTWSDFIQSSGAWQVVVNLVATPTITLNGNVLHSDAPIGNQWYNQNGAIDLAIVQDLSVTKNGDYHVIATLYGCNSDTSNHITMDIENMVGAIASTGDTICANGDPIEISSTTSPNGSKTTYKWQANGVDIANSDSASFDPPIGLTETTTYTRWAKDSTWSDFIQSSGAWQVVVNLVTTPTITLNGNVLHSDAPIGNQWYNQNGAIDLAINQEFTATENGDYHVVATVAGCSSDTSNHISINTVDIENRNTENLLRIYPNPVSNELMIEAKTTGNRINIEIWNPMGQMVYCDQVTGKTTVQTTHFTPGIYTIRIENGKTVEFKKMIKK